jgi:hypothetical protein
MCRVICQRDYSSLGPIQQVETELRDFLLATREEMGELLNSEVKAVLQVEFLML